MWQKCPICNGAGHIDTNRPVSIQTKDICPTCVGQRIIGSDGKPPKSSFNFNDLPIYYWNGDEFKKIKVERGKPSICDEILED